jgi:tRNA G46 methylase TrmB
VLIANELHNPAIEKLKQKLEERTLKNYENVLEDVRKQLTTYVSPEKHNPVQ